MKDGFGDVEHRVPIDQGHFESHFFRQLNELTGTIHLRTAAWWKHSIGNERQQLNVMRVADGTTDRPARHTSNMEGRSAGNSSGDCVRRDASASGTIPNPTTNRKSERRR